MDFAVSDKMKTIVGMINEFVDKELIPLEHEFLTKDFKQMELVLEEKRRMVKQMELWAPNQDKEYGGLGLNLVEHGLVSEALGRTPLGHYVFNCQAPDAGNMEILFEAGAKMLLYKDKELIDVKPHDISYMHGAKADPGMNINSYFMTDEKRHSTRLEVLVNEEPVESLYLPDDPADSRGVLSWHYQENDRKLQEAGSYGYLQRVRIPSRLVAGIKRDGGFRLKLRVQDCLCKDEGGLALYGRNAGRYPIDILVRYW